VEIQGGNDFPQATAYQLGSVPEGCEVVVRVGLESPLTGNKRIKKNEQERETNPFLKKRRTPQYPSRKAREPKAETHKNHFNSLCGTAHGVCRVRHEEGESTKRGVGQFKTQLGMLVRNPIA